MKDLSPNIYRQRLVIEWYPGFTILESHIKEFLSKLSLELDMVTLIEPVTHKSEKFWWAWWIHWETSWAHFYSWENPSNFFSIDIYTCKKFDPKNASDFTNDFFKCKEIVFKSF